MIQRNAARPSGGMSPSCTRRADREGNEGFASHVAQKRYLEIERAPTVPFANTPTAAGDASSAWREGFAFSVTTPQWQESRRVSIVLFVDPSTLASEEMPRGRRLHPRRRPDHDAHQL